MQMSSPEWRKDYQKKRYIERLNFAREKLGGKCAKCGNVDGLEFDHINPSTKTANIPIATMWSEERWLAELAKCQLLCRLCHLAKNGQEAIGRRLTTHGRVKQYQRGCRCNECVDAQRVVWERYNHTTRRNKKRIKISGDSR